MKRRRIASVALSMALAMGALPAAALAVEGAESPAAMEELASALDQSEQTAAEQSAENTAASDEETPSDAVEQEVPATEDSAAEDPTAEPESAAAEPEIELQAPRDGWGTTSSGDRVWYVDGEIARSQRFTDPATGETYYAKANGTIAEDEEYYDAASDAWYYADEDGHAITDQDFYIEDLDKTVHYDERGRMVKGELYSYFPEDNAYHWRYFHPVTGALQTGFSYVVEQDKWCYYDPDTAWMVYDEQYIDGGWYYFDPCTGAMDYEFAYLPKQDKWVYYDPITGRMVYGQRMVDGRPYYFDKVTGRQLTAQELKDKLVQQARASYFTHPDCDAEFEAAGGTRCPHGPCMAYVWWCFHHADLDIFLADNVLMSSYPHENLDWYKERGRVDFNAGYGDIIFFRYQGFAFDKGYSASHVGIVVGPATNGVLVADAAFSSIEPRVYPINGDTAGVAHPYWGD